MYIDMFDVWDKVNNDPKTDTEIAKMLSDEEPKADFDVDWLVIYSEVVDWIVCRIISQYVDGRPNCGTPYYIDDRRGVMAVIYSIGDEMFFTTVEFGSCTGCDCLQSAIFYFEQGKLKQAIDDIKSIIKTFIQNSFCITDGFNYGTLKANIRDLEKKIDEKKKMIRDMNMFTKDQQIYQKIYEGIKAVLYRYENN